MFEDVPFCSLVFPCVPLCSIMFFLIFLSFFRFAKDRSVIDRATDLLEYSSGNFYINDKCTGAVVGQQPFGGGRASGTNDKAGSALNLLRWFSPRTIKVSFVPISDFSYPSCQ